MEDESIFTRSQQKEISDGLQSFIDSMVEEIVLEGKPFDTQKKYLKKFSENEGLDFNKLEADISTFVEILDSLKTAFSKLQVKLAEEKGSDCHISEEIVKKLVSYSSPKNSQEVIIPEAIVIKNPEPEEVDDSDKPKKKKSWFWIVGIGAAATITIAILFGISHSESDLDTDRYYSCQTVDDYRNYIIDFGHNAKYYNEAKQFIDNYMADSVTKSEAQRKAQKEEDLYNSCTTIAKCDNYLSQYPQGRYCEEVTTKKIELTKNKERKLESDYYKGKIINNDSEPIKEKDTKVYDVVEQMPSFPGGWSALLQYLSSNIKYPAVAEENGVQGRVVVTFVIDRDGSITDVTVVQSVDPSLDNEAKRVVRNMPKWISGKQNGSAVRVKYTLPITFSL